MKCPNCGAEIGRKKSCEYCGTQITLDMQRTQEQLNKEGCPKCHSTNIQFKRENQGEIRGKKSKQVVHKTIGFCKDCGYTWLPTGVGQQEPKKNNLWLWVLGWICIFPVPLTILMLRKKEMKSSLKYGIIAFAWIIYLIIGLSGNSSDKSENTHTATSTPVVETTTATTTVTSALTETETTIVTSMPETTIADTLTFIIIPDEKGDYGFENTLNAGTEFEETQVVYHIPSGTYSVTNLGEFPGQFQACSDETHITDEGWEEPVKIGQVVAIKANETAEFTIEDGYYLEVHLNGKLEFVQK